MIAAIYARKSTAEDDKHEQARSCQQQLAAGQSLDGAGSGVAVSEQ